LTTQAKTYIPNFSSIDTEAGLSHMAEDKKLYLKILHDFYKHYSNFNLDQLDHETFAREVHTINSLSANIGAKKLHTITKALDKTHNKMLLPQFYKALHRVIDDLQIVQNLQKNQTNKKFANDITPLVKDALFMQLKTALEDELPKQCYNAIEELDQYTLSSNDDIIVQKIKCYLDEFDFDTALEVL